MRARNRRVGRHRRRRRQWPAQHRVSGADAEIGIRGSMSCEAVCIRAERPRVSVMKWLFLLWKSAVVIRRKDRAPAVDARIGA